MRRILIIHFLVILLVLFLQPITSGKAADTAAILGGGVCINEVLPDPTASPGFDTDDNGTPADGDEFVELYNLSTSSIDISGWELWDKGRENWYTFPGNPGDGTTSLASGAYAVVVVGVQSGGSLPTMTNPESLVFDNGSLSGVFNNDGDNLVLYDPGEDEYIQLRYNNETADNPPVDYSADGFSTTASRVGQVEDWGSDADGKSLTRCPSGDTNVEQHDITPGGEDASPTAIQLTFFKVAPHKIRSIWPGLIVVALLGISLILRKMQCEL